MNRTGFLKKVWSEALPFVARSPEMKVAWLVGVLRKKSLTNKEIAPYIHLLLTEYQYNKETNHDAALIYKTNKLLTDIFAELPRDIIVQLLECAELYDIPLLLEIINHITVDEAILILKKTPPSYEKRPTRVFDRVFQAIHNCGEHLLSQAKTKMQDANEMPEHFTSVYERFQEILKDKEILSSIFPQAKASDS